MSSRARNRPPRLEPRVGNVQPAPPATPAELLERAKVAGPSHAPGPTELRRLLEHVVAGDRVALGDLAPVKYDTVADAWGAMHDIYGASADDPRIDPDRTLAASAVAAARVRAVGERGGRIGIATAAPASLLPLLLAFARLARHAGAEVVDCPDVGPMRADGRSSRWIRWVDGVAAVTDGEALCSTHDRGVAQEWLFVAPRPALTIADGVFADAAAAAGLEVVALAGLDRSALALTIHRSGGTLVPLRTDRPTRAYAPVVAALHQASSTTEL
jgi:hypothetical protein